MSRDHFTTTSRGLDRESPPMRLFEKAKRLGIWNPSALDFSQDRADWAKLSADEQEVILHLTALFEAGEEAVTLDILPLIMTIAREGRLEEEIFLSTFLWEEAKHTDFFERFLREVPGIRGSNLSRFHSVNYKSLFYDALPNALNSLSIDSSPQAQVIASVTYNMIIEGVLAETGYHAYHAMLSSNGIMPALTQGIAHLKQDESRHIAYGIYLISRLVAENPETWDVAESTMNALFPPAVGVIQEVFEAYNPIPFGLVIDDFIGYAAMQFQKRFARIAQSKGAALADVLSATHAVIEAEDS